MKRSKTGSIATAVFLALAGCLQALGQGATPPPTGRFGLPAAKPAAAAASAPATASAVNNAAPPPPSAPAPSAPPAQTGGTGSRSLLHGAVIKLVNVDAVGTKQGQLGKGIIECTKFQFQPTVPIDAATGRPTGARKLGPVTITKRYDAASIPLLQALSTNEVLTTVTLTFLDAGPTGSAITGKEITAFTVKLSNATVTAVNQYFDTAGLVEDVTFSFNKIDISDSKASFTDQNGVK